MNEFHPVDTSTPLDDLLPQNRHDSSISVEACTSLPSQQQLLPSSDSSSQKSVSNTQQHHTCEQSSNLSHHPESTRPVSKKRSLSPIDYSPHLHNKKEKIENTSSMESSPDAFNNLPFHPIDEKRKLEPDRSNSPTLCKQEVEQVTIPRSISLSESFSNNAGEDQNVYEEWEPIQHNANDTRSAYLPESFPNNIDENDIHEDEDPIHQYSEDTTVGSPQNVAISSSPIIADDSKTWSHVHHEWSGRSRHSDHKKAQLENIPQHPSYEIPQQPSYEIPQQPTYEIPQHSSYEIPRLNHGLSSQENYTSYYVDGGRDVYSAENFFDQHDDVSTVENQLVVTSVSYDGTYNNDGRVCHDGF